MEKTHDFSSPSPFVLSCLTRIRQTLGDKPSALDLAMGSGRHSVVLAETGFLVYGVDCSHEKQVRAQARLAAQGLFARMWTGDLQVGGMLPRCRFDLVVCTHYLQRTLWNELCETVRPGGFVIYETFTAEQSRYNWGPRSQEFLLESGDELRRAFGEWNILEYEERKSPIAQARLLARRPS